jgi:hypothetical protein
MRRWCTYARKSQRRASRDPRCRASYKYAHGPSAYASRLSPSVARLCSSAPRLPLPGPTTAVKVVGAAAQTKAVAPHTKATAAPAGLVTAKVTAATAANRAPLRRRRPGAVDPTKEAPAAAKPPPPTRPRGTAEKPNDLATRVTAGATTAKAPVAALAADRQTKQVNQTTAKAVAHMGAVTATRAPAKGTRAPGAATRAPGAAPRTRAPSSRRRRLALPRVLEAQPPTPQTQLACRLCPHLRRLRPPPPAHRRQLSQRRHCLCLAPRPIKFRLPARLIHSRRRAPMAGTRMCAALAARIPRRRRR